MSSVLVINAAGRETRVALVEQGHIAEFYLERKKDRGIVGNIYKGRVTRVLPGMQAAFVDIGLDKAGFLYVGDVLFDPDVTRHQFDMTEGETDEDVDEVPEDSEETSSADAAAPQSDVTPPNGTAIDEAASASEASTSGADVVAAAVAEANPAPTGADVVAAAVSESTPPASGAEVVAAAVEQQGEPIAPLAVETDKLEAQRTQAPRDVRFKEKDKNRERGDRQRKAEPPKKQQKIEDLLKVGQEVLVQVSKDPIGTKGARITSHISVAAQRSRALFPAAQARGSDRKRHERAQTPLSAVSRSVFRHGESRCAAAWRRSRAASLAHHHRRGAGATRELVRRAVVHT